MFSHPIASLLGQSKEDCQKIQSRHIQKGPGSLEASVQTRANGGGGGIKLGHFSLLLYYKKEEKIIQ